MSYGNAWTGSKKKLKLEVDKTKLTPKNVWGKVVLYLKENKIVDLHVACGDITDVAIVGNKLIVRSSDDFLISVLEDGIKELENALRWQGLDLQVEIVKFENINQKQEKDIIKLTKFFNDKLKID